MAIIKKNFLKGLLAATLCACSLAATGCSKIPTSDLPPTTLDNYTYSSDNNYFTDDAKTEPKFITVVDGEITEANNFYFNGSYTHQGLNYKIDVTYTKLDKKIVVADLQEKKDDAYFLKVPVEQDRGFFICLNVPSLNFYPVLYDARNNSIRDILADTGAEKLWISDFTASPDFKKILLVSDKDETVYLCDPREKSLSDMKVLTGVFDLSGAVWVDSTHLLLTKTNDEGIFETWIYNTDNGESKLTTDRYSLFNEETKHGLILFGSRYALNITEKGKLQSVDLRSGIVNDIAGYTYNEFCSIDQKTHNEGTLLLVTKTDAKKFTNTAYLINLKEGKILKQRAIPSDFKHVAFYDENNLIAYTTEDSYSVYHMGND